MSVLESLTSYAIIHFVSNGDVSVLEDGCEALFYCDLTPVKYPLRCMHAVYRNSRTKYSIREYKSIPG